MGVYTGKDADPSALEGQRIAVIGYGNLGRSIALNLRDNDAEVVVGNIDDGYRAEALEAGFATLGIAAAVEAADLVFAAVVSGDDPMTHAEARVRRALDP